MKIKKLLLVLACINFCFVADAQKTVADPTIYTNGIRMSRLVSPVMNGAAWTNYFDSVNKGAIHNGTAYQYIATEPWVLGNYAPLSRTLTINGVTFDLSANRTWTITTGSVTSVALTVPTGLVVNSGSPITTNGTIAVGLQSGYSIPTTADQSNWNTAYGWGDHASAGYELAYNKSTSTSLGTSDVLYPTQKAVKTYVDNKLAGFIDFNYTPSISYTSGVTSTTARNCYYTVVGSNVTVYGSFDITPSTIGAIQVKLTLPYGVISADADLVGHGSSQNVQMTGIVVNGDGSGNKATVQMTAAAMTASTVNFSFMYRYSSL